MKLQFSLGRVERLARQVSKTHIRPGLRRWYDARLSESAPSHASGTDSLTPAESRERNLLFSPFGARFVSFAVLVLMEWLPVSSFMHTRRGGQSGGRAVVVFLSLFLAFGYLRNRPAIRLVSDQVREFQISWRYLAFHLLAMLAFLEISALPIQGTDRGFLAILLDFAWYSSGICAIVLSGFIFLTPRLWWALLRGTGNLWVYAAAGGAFAWSFVKVSWTWWNNPSVMPVTDATFNLVRLLLRPFVPALIVDRATLSIGSPTFAVSIGDACSGVEGAGLMLTFSVIWLWLFRRECRFPRAFLVIPASIALIFLLNAVRIVALILMGSAGAPAIAEGGFHSQAGWIAFNVVALGCAFVAPRLKWLGADGGTVGQSAAETNPTVPYLLPFASILAAGMLSRAASARFEWLYPLRFAAACVALWICRRGYKGLSWRISWEAPLAGAAVFVAWLALDRGPHPDNGIASGLAALGPAARVAWLVVRTIAAVVTVPVAEELAFRGFLLRRFVSSDFEAVDFRRFTWFAVAASSLLFGVLHGGHWVAGTLAGLIYACVTIRRGSLGDAVVAHSTTNALLAAMVLTRDNWYLW